MVGDEGDEFLAQNSSSDHPLVVRAPTMVIGPVQPRSRYALVKPHEQVLPAGVHPQGDLGLTAVTAEMPLPCEYSEEKADIAWRKIEHGASLTDLRPGPLLLCFTVMFLVKRDDRRRIDTADVAHPCFTAMFPVKRPAQGITELPRRRGVLEPVIDGGTAQSRPGERRIMFHRHVSRETSRSPACVSQVARVRMSNRR